MIKDRANSKLFQSFTNQIPDDIYSKANIFKGKNLAIFVTNSFVAHSEIICPDYHFAIPTVQPPLTSIDNKTYKFKKNRIVVFNPYTKIKVLEDIKTKDYYVVCIKRDYIKDIANDIGNTNGVTFEYTEHLYSHKLMTYLRDFINEAKYNGIYTSLMLESITSQVVIQLLRDTNNSLSNALPKPHFNNTYMETAIDYIKTYYNVNLTLEDICNQVHMSPTHFNRSFREYTGLSPHKYLVRIRLAKSIDYLKDTSLTITDIAYLCGFISVSHFSSTFSNYFGVSPTKFRKINN